MIGHIINGYEVKKFLGKGQFGEVFLVLKGKRKFAIKFIRTEFIYKDIEEKRLKREIAALKNVDGKYTVKYYEDGEYVYGHTHYKYIVMELVEGQTLREYLHSATPLDFNEAKKIIVQVLRGLSDIHSKKIIHRDLKPENIKITKDGKIKILDYGLAKIIDYSSITQTGAKIGTYYYMSPEQVKGEKPIREGSDYYGIGVILFELLTGHILFYPSTDAEIVYKTVYVKPPYPSKYNAEIPNYIENLILKLLEKEVTKRYRSIDEIIQMLDSGATVKKPEKKEVKKFYPRLIQNDTAVIEKFLDHYQVDGANFPINLHSQYKKINDLLKSRSTKIDFFADPGTNRLVFSKFRNTKGLKALPYAPDGFDPLDGDDFKDISSIKKFVEKVINLQIANGCSVLTAPFFYFENIGDDWFDINIKMLKESIDLIRRKYPQYKISGAICTNAEIFCRKKERSAIINQYGHCDPDFLQFYIDKICENTVDAQIYNFIKAALEIKNFNKTKIVACRVPAVAMGLLTVGFDAITSGLAVLESFDKGVITKEEDSARMPTRRYFPELLLSVSMTSKTKLHEEILAIESQIKKDNPKIKFNFECNCPGCQKNPMLSDIFQKPRLHFLCIRGMEIKELNDIKTSEQKKYFFARIDKAYYLQKELIKNGLKLNSPEYLMTWKDILKRF